MEVGIFELRIISDPLRMHGHCMDHSPLIGPLENFEPKSVSILHVSFIAFHGVLCGAGAAPAPAAAPVVRSLNPKSMLLGPFLPSQHHELHIFCIPACIWIFTAGISMVDNVIYNGDVLRFDIHLA